MKLTKVLCTAAILTGHCLANIFYSDHFGEIRRSPDFVDKTLFIKAFSNIKKSFLVAAPGGFGKSTNLYMLRSFLSADVNKTHGENLFRDTEIFKDSNFTKKELGNYAVLYCSFKQKKPVLDYPSLVNVFRSILYQTFAMHPYLIRSKRISTSDKKKLSWFVGIKKHLWLKPTQVLSGLHFLSKVLRDYHDKEVVLIIDDYDSIILDCIFTSELNYTMVLGFHNALFSAILHNNKYINKAILVGTTCTCFKPLLQLQQHECFSFLRDERFAPFFGITDNEIDQLLAKKDFKKVSNKKRDIRRWYGGYMSPDLKTQVHNTRSTLNFLNSGKLKSYWANTRVLKTLKLLLIEPEVETLLNTSIKHEPIEINVFDKIEQTHVKELRSFTDFELWNKDYSDLLIYLLMEKGYFTFANEWNGMENRLTIKIPNEEIQTVFEKIFTSFLENPVELLDRLKAAVHEISFGEKKEVDTLLNEIS